jgi:hypothetical protein
MKYVGLSILALAALIGLGWLFAGNNLALRKVFAPAHEQVRRETFEESKAYRDGMVQELRAMQFEYLKADDSRKAGMANVIRHRLAGFPEEALPRDLQDFIHTISIEESP